MGWDLEVVIPSKGRPGCEPVLGLFNDPLLCVGESEADLYAAAHPGRRLLIHPEAPRGTTLSWVRQYILDQVQHDTVLMVDDDITSFACLVGQRYRRFTDPNDIEQAVISTAEVAREVGTAIFGFAHTIDVRNFLPFAPFSFTGYANGCACGFIGREFHFDTTLVTKSDIDICLQVLRDRRVLWRDLRFAFETREWFRRLGGMSGVRTIEVIERDCARLAAKWGRVVEVNHLRRRGEGKHKSVQLHVQR